jgi:photosystem II stability/assembly factor-like uncharacterized protein
MKSMKAFTLTALCVLLALGLFSPFHTHADPLDNWQVRKVLSENTRLDGIAFGNGLFVAVGVNGMILTSSDGVSWTPRESGTSEGLSGITYGKNIYVAVGRSGTILISPDGTTWTSRKSGSDAVLANVRYIKGLFIVVGGDPGTILTSPDGITWTDRTPFPMNEFLNDVAFGNDTYLIVGTVVRAFSEVILQSTDGIHWSRISQGTGPSLGPLIFAKDSFYSGDFFGQLWTTPNGTDWTVQRLNEQFPTPCVQDIDDIVYGNDIFLAVGSGNQCMLTSSDGTNWSVKTAEAPLWKVTYGKGTFVAIGPQSIAQSDPFAVSNTPPSQPDLMYPAQNQNISGTSVTLRWKESTDPDNDAISYQLHLCDNPDFAGCQPRNIASLETNRTVHAGIGGSFMLLSVCGFFLTPVMVVLSGKTKLFAGTLAAIAVALLISCGGGGGGDINRSVSPDEITFRASGLARETTYYWKIAAVDSAGASTESVTQGFKTGSP